MNHSEVLGETDKPVPKVLLQNASLKSITSPGATYKGKKQYSLEAGDIQFSRQLDRKTTRFSFVPSRMSSCDKQNSRIWH